jgi:hypothetical protein
MKPQVWDRDSDEYKELFALVCELNGLNSASLSHDEALAQLRHRYGIEEGVRLVLVSQDEMNIAVKEAARYGYMNKKLGIGVRVPPKDTGRSIMVSEMLSELKGCVSSPGRFSSPFAPCPAWQSGEVAL